MSLLDKYISVGSGILFQRVDSMVKAEKYVKMALGMGAEDSKVISVNDLVFDPRTLLKCMYGCDDWGKNWTCPSTPKALRPWEAEKILKKYTWGILVHTKDPKLAQEISFEVEMKAFFDGYPLAFSMFDCYLCETCVFPDPCRFPEKARPSMQALGIDVFSTVKKQGLPIEPLKTKGEKPNYYALVLIE